MAALVNDLGTGSPNLTMKLTAWGGSWKDKYDLNYKSQGNVPGGDPGQGNTTWSAWNVFDEKNTYYGTITLHSDGKDSIWMGPEAYKPDGATETACWISLWRGSVRASTGSGCNRYSRLSRSHPWRSQPWIPGRNIPSCSEPKAQRS